jgi:hypothetical protein
VRTALRDVDAGWQWISRSVKPGIGIQVRIYSIPLDVREDATDATDATGERDSEGFDGDSDASDKPPEERCGATDDDVWGFKWWESESGDTGPPDASSLMSGGMSDASSVAETPAKSRRPVASDASVASSRASVDDDIEEGRL